MLFHFQGILERSCRGLVAPASAYLRCTAAM